MRAKQIIKSFLQVTLIAVFAIFFVVPALVESPASVYAESAAALAGKAKAKQLAAARLLKRAMREEEAAKKEALYASAAARCQSTGGPHPCSDGRGNAISIAKASDCGKCAGSGCDVCCDALAATNADICKLAC